VPRIINGDRPPPSVRVAMPPSQNRLLNHLLATDREFLLPHLRIQKFSFNDVIYEYGDAIDEIYFPLDCVVSNLAIMEDGTTIETSLVGNEGIVGLSGILDGSAARHWTRMCIGGSMARLSTSALDHTFTAREGALRHIMVVYRSLVVQTSQRAVCNARHTVLERLACWLLMIHDRVGGDNLKLTQEAIASRLGARRAGITVAAGVLQSIGAIDYRRGQLHIKDRSSLERAVCECYAILQSDYEELEGGAPRSSHSDS